MIKEHGREIQELCIECETFFENESLLTQHIIEKHVKAENLVEKTTIYMYLTPANPKILEVVMKGTLLIPYIVQYQCIICHSCKSYIKNDIIEHQRTDHELTAHYQQPTASQNHQSTSNSVCEDIQIVSVCHVSDSS